MADTKKTKEEEPVSVHPEPELDPANPSMEQIQAERERTAGVFENIAESDPPGTSTFVTFPSELRDGPDAGEHKDHDVMVSQVRTYDAGRAPEVTLRCACSREYTVAWTEDVAKKIIKV